MITYQTKISPLTGTNGSEVYPKARLIYNRICSRTKRHPYVHSLYFNGQKVFLEYFWSEIWTKNWRDRVRRLKFYPCAIDLIVNSRLDPSVKINSGNVTKILYRFAGITTDGRMFFVQIKEHRTKQRKYFMSVFPEE